MSLGFGQILIITLLIFVIFGAGKLPSVMSDLAKGLRAFKKGMADDENQPPVMPQKIEDKSSITPAPIPEPQSTVDPIHKSQS